MTNPAKIDPPPQPLPLLRLLRTIIKNPIQAWPLAIYRERVVRSQVLGRDALYVMTPDLIRQVLVDDADAFEKGEITRRALGPALGDALLTSDGPRWRWQRRAAAPIFRQERIESYLPSIIAIAGRTRDRWAALPPGTEIDVAREMMHTTFDIILETMVSGQGDIDAELMAQAITDYLESTSWVFALAVLGAPRWMPFPGFLKARRGRAHLRRVLDRVIADARRNPLPRNDLLSQLMGATDPETGQSMTNEDLRFNLLTFISAGHETTALALTWTFYLLSIHPAIEDRVRQEIAAVTGGDALRPEHVERLVYTRQVVYEAMRLYPPAALVVRAALRPVTIGDHTLERGAFVYIPIYAVHRHETLWDNPDVFDPDRFDAASLKSRDRYSYLPFGAGPRICIGMSFAQTEAVAVLATLLNGVQLRLRAGYVPQPKLRVTLRPAEGMPMHVTSTRFIATGDKPVT
jgi:cytochrome P450